MTSVANLGDTKLETVSPTLPPNRRWPQVAGHVVPRLDLDEGWVYDLAGALDDGGAPRMEAAAGGWLGRTGRLSGDGGSLPQPVGGVGLGDGPY
jgi:hypothetical protein